MTVVGNTVYAHGQLAAEGLDSQTMQMWVVEGGKVTAFTAFDDTDSMRQAMVAQ